MNEGLWLSDTQLTALSDHFDMGGVWLAPETTLDDRRKNMRAVASRWSTFPWIDGKMPARTNPDSSTDFTRTFDYALYFAFASHLKYYTEHGDKLVNVESDSLRGTAYGSLLSDVPLAAQNILLSGYVHVNPSERREARLRGATVVRMYPDPTVGSATPTPPSPSPSPSPSPTPPSPPSGPIGTAGIEDGAVTSDKLADNSVTSAKIVNGTITADDIASGVIPTELPPTDGSVTAAKIPDGVITGAKLADDTIPNSKMAAGSIGTTELINASVTPQKTSGIVTDDDLIGGNAVFKSAYAGSAAASVFNSGGNSDGVFTILTPDSAPTFAPEDFVALDDISTTTYTAYTLVLGRRQSQDGENVFALTTAMIDNLISAPQFIPKGNAKLEFRHIDGKDPTLVGGMAGHAHYWYRIEFKRAGDFGTSGQLLNFSDRAPGRKAPVIPPDDIYGKIPGSKIQDASIPGAKIENNAISNNMIADSTIQAAKLANGVLPSDAQIGEKAFDNVPTDLDSSEKLEVTERTGAVNKDEIKPGIDGSYIGQYLASFIAAADRRGQFAIYNQTSDPPNNDNVFATLNAIPTTDTEVVVAQGTTMDASQFAYRDLTATEHQSIVRVNQFQAPGPAHLIWSAVGARTVIGTAGHGQYQYFTATVRRVGTFNPSYAFVMFREQAAARVPILIAGDEVQGLAKQAYYEGNGNEQTIDGRGGAEGDVWTRGSTDRNAAWKGFTTETIKVRRYGTELTQDPVVLNTTVTQAHGLGKIPDGIYAYIQCKTANRGYAVGDRVSVGNWWDTALSYDATNLTFYSGNPQGMQNKTADQRGGIAPGSWSFHAIPYVIEDKTIVTGISS